MALGGYADKVAWVDLTTGRTEFKPIPEEYKLKYIGARGVGVRFVFDNGPSVDPLSPDNPIILGAGPLVATGTPGASKIVATTRFPLNGAISESVGSMRFALNLKGAGFDHDTNKIYFIEKDSETEFDLMQKSEVANIIVNNN